MSSSSYVGLQRYEDDIETNENTVLPWCFALGSHKSWLVIQCFHFADTFSKATWRKRADKMMYCVYYMQYCGFCNTILLGHSIYNIVL